MLWSRKPGLEKKQGVYRIYLFIRKYCRKERVLIWTFRSSRPHTRGERSMACHLDIGQQCGMALVRWNRYIGILSDKGRPSYSCQCRMGYRWTVCCQMEQQSDSFYSFHGERCRLGLKVSHLADGLGRKSYQALSGRWVIERDSVEQHSERKSWQSYESFYDSAIRVTESGCRWYKRRTDRRRGTAYEVWDRLCESISEERRNSQRGDLGRQ